MSTSNPGQLLELTCFQKELWLANNALPEGHPGLYSGGRFVLEGCPDPAILERALALLFEHFPILSATFRQTQEALPRLELGAHPTPLLRVVDVRNCADPEHEAQRLFEDFREAAFDPIGGRLCSFDLILIGEARSFFVSRLFHLIGDGVFCASLFSLIAEVYDCLQAAQEPELGTACAWEQVLEEDIRYGDSEHRRKSVEFWADYLKQLPDERAFKPRLGCPDRIDTIGLLEYHLSPEAYADWLALAERFASAASLLQALHMVVLARLLDVETLSFQVPFLLGERKDIRKIHGCRISIVPIIATVQAEESFAGLLARLKKLSVSLMRHVKTPFQEGLRCLQDWRAYGHLWDTNANYFPLAPKGGSGDFRLHSFTPIVSQYEPTLLGIYAFDNGGDFQLSIPYSRNHFTEADVRRYAQRIERLLSRVRRDPEVSIADLDLLLDEEKAHLENWQAGEAKDFFTGTIPDLFDRVARVSPERAAVLAEEGEARDYGTLSRRSDEIAHWLQGLGVRAGEVVAVLARRHPALAEYILGIMKAGAVYLPIDPDYPAERVDFMLTDSGVRHVLALGAEDARIVLALARIVPDDLPAAKPSGRPDSESPAYLIYTSGSTGRPKGVLIPHRGFVNMIQGQIALFGVTPEDRVLQFASPSFDASLSEIFMALLAGACSCPVSRALLDEPWQLKDYMASRGVTVVTFPPSYLSLFQRERFPGLRVLITAGESPIAEDARHYARELAYFNAYGPTEASVCATIGRVSPDQEGLIGIGRPIPNTQIYIFDRQGRQVVPGLPGELCLGGVGLALGYLNRPELDEEKFFRAACAHGERVYRTGDRAVWAENGEIVLLGRIDDQVKIRGHRIEPGEVAEVLERHPEVKEACVLAVPGLDASLELCAFLVLSADGDAAAIRHWLQSHLPLYMVPSRFRVLAAMPLAPTGKVDRRELLRQAQKAESEALVSEEGSPLEQAVRAHFEAVLGHPVASLGMDFFSMGGDSLKAMALAQRLAQVFFCKFSVREFMASSSVVEFAKFMSCKVSPAAQDEPETDTLSLSQGQMQLWVQECVSGPSSRYNMPLAFEMETEEHDLERFAAGLLQVIDSQPSCRCRVEGEIDSPRLLVTPGSGAQIERIDLRGEADPVAYARQIFESYCNRPFDLTQAPLLRLTLLRLGARRWRWLIVMHHLIGDGESLRILLQDAVRSVRGEAPAAVPAAVLRQFAEAERTYLDSPNYRNDLAFWQGQLAPLPARLDFADTPRPAVKKGQGDMVRQTLSSEASHRLKALAEQAGISVLGCFVGLLQRFLRTSGKAPDITIAVPVGLRDEPALLHTVGYFVNTVLVRSTEAVEADLLAALRQTGQRLREAIQHSRVPFGLLPAALGEPRDPSRSPLVDVMATQIDEALILPADTEGLRFRPLDVTLRSAKFDATFILASHADDRSELVLEHDTDILSEAAACELLSALAAFIEGKPADTRGAARPLAPVEPRAILAQAWQHILGGPVPGPEASFFLAGGDSIKAIQMVGLLRRKGIKSLTPTQFFESPGFEALCARIEAGSNPEVSPPAPLPDTPIPLLPIQRQLIGRHPEHWRAFHMAMTARLDQRIDMSRLRQALNALPDRHEALRLAFSEDSARLLRVAPAPFWDEFSLPETVSRDAAFEEAARRLFPRLSPAGGPLLGAVVVRRGEEHLFLLGGHHLILDAVSLDLLRRDLAWFCAHGEWPTASAGPGLATWAFQLAVCDYPDQVEIHDWVALCAAPTSPLSAIRPGGVDRVENRVRRLRSFAGAAAAIARNPRSALLAALALALHRIGQGEPLSVLIESHGREAIIPGLDISQAVGWFTATFPLVLKPSSDLAASAAGLSEWFEHLPHGGIGHGLAAQRHEGLTFRPQIALNYLGRLFAESDDETIAPLPELASPDVLPGLLPAGFESDAPLDLLVSFSARDEISLGAYFSPECLDTAWVEALLAAWQQALLDLSALQLGASAGLKAQLAELCLCGCDDIEAISRPDPAQEGMLFQHLLDAGASQTYVQQINFRLEGPFDEALLMRAWTQVVARHESLRSLFPASADGEFHRLVLKRGRDTVEYLDLSHLPAALQEARRDALLRTRRETPFDLARGPLLQCQLLRFGPERSEMSWCLHHLLMDGWCTGILLRELFSSYVALRQNRPPALPPAPGLGAYRAWLNTRQPGAAQAFWRDLLAGYSRPSLMAPAGSEAVDEREERELSLTVEATRSLQQAAARLSVSLPHLVQALWGLILGALNGRREAVYGIVSAGRPTEVEGIEQMVGLFIQTLPVRMAWQGDETFSALVMRVREQAVARAAHEHLSLAEIQRLAEVSGPLFDSLVVVENYPLDGIVQAGAPRIVGVSGFEQHPYAFGLAVVPGERLLFRFTGQPACFREGRLEAGWLALVEALAGDREWRCSDLEALVAPSAAVPASFNATERPYPRESSVCEVFRAQAAAHPAAKALIATDGTVWDYQRLDEVSDAVATGLGESVRGEVVALSMPRGPEVVAAMLGILKAGASYLPLDEKSPPQRQAAMLDTAACRYLVHGRNDLHREGQKPSALHCLDFGQLIVSGTAPLAPLRPEPMQAAYVMFTSGSTGEPKGVVVPHRAILRLVCNSDFWQVEPGERVLQAGPLGFDASTLEIWGPLLNGGTVCFISDDELLSPGGLKRKLHSARITQMWLTSSLCNLLADEAPSSFAPLRRLFTGGETLSPTHVGKILSVCPELEIVNGYGPTENTTFTTTHRVTVADLNGAIPIGRPVANTRVHIVGESGLPVAVGEWGEICAAGDGLALGYVGRDDLTRRVFVDLPPPVNERVYRTGDIGRWRADGLIEFQGRRDGQIKLRGFRIELAEIESTLTGLPGVHQAAVLVVGSGAEKRLTAFVKADFPAAPLREKLQAVLPAYMIPDRIECLDALPLNANGKIDRGALENFAQDARRTPIDAGSRPAATLAGALETRIAEAFGEILGIDDVPTDADFFELGGHSLKAMRLLGRLKQSVCARLSMRDVMVNPSVAGLARRIRELGIAERGPGSPIFFGEQDDYPLASGQERLWFLQHLQPESVAYHVPFAARLPGDIDTAALQHALSLIEARHDALRLRMPASLDDGAPRQRIAPAGGLRLEIRDFRDAAAPGEAVAVAIEAALSHPFRFGFDAPLVRAGLFLESAEAAIFLLELHHLVCDGWSSEIFLRELQEAYAGALVGQTPDWPPLPLRYVDYAAWQRDYLASPACESEKTRWQERMTPLPEPIALPIDRPRPAILSQQGDVLDLRLDTSRLDRLKALARESSLTLFPVLAALVNTFLYRHTGQTDLVVGVPVAGREDESLQGMIGFFVNTLPLRSQLDTHAGFTRLVGEIGQSWREALADQLYPLEMLVNDLKVRREASRNPLFDVIVSLEDAAWQSAAEQGVLKFSPFPLPRRQSKLDLSFYFREAADGLQIEIEFATDLFERASIERMGQRFVKLVDAVLASPECPLRELPLMPEAERELVLNGFNATEVGWSLNGSMDDRFAQALAERPDAIALRTSENGGLSYREFDRRITELAASLQAQGILPGAFVGVCHERSIEMMLSIFAILRVGAVYVPFVPGLPSARVTAMVEDLGSCAMLAAPVFAEDFRSLGMRVLDPTPVDTVFVAPPLTDDAAAYVIFTSGSTGRPKGVLVEQRGVLNRIFWMQSCYPLGEHDVILQKTPISFDVSVWELFWWSWNGASLALLAPGGEKDPAAIVEAIERHRVTVMHFVPSMLHAFLDHLERHPDAVTRLASLRRVFASGEALTSELVARFNRLLYEVHGTELHNLYGPTEATVDVSWQPCSPLEEGGSVPIGRPISNTRLYVLDEAGQPVPIGASGELFISGVQVARGYVGRPDLTAERFLTDPFAPPLRMYRTGDIARWLPNGAVEYLGRCDDQVKIRGFRIELGEIEAALERCTDVSQAVVRVGQIGGMPALEAFLVPAPGGELKLTALRRELGGSLPDYMCPAAFFTIDHVPVSTSGKTDRKALQGRRLSLRETSAALVGPVVTETEQALAGIWSLLFPEAGEIDPEQNFFDLGGNSLLLIRLHEALQARWPASFSLAELFVAVTIRQQAAHLDGKALDERMVVPAKSASEHAIAVIGMALRLADYDDAESFWSDLLSGADRTGPLSDKRLAELAELLAATGETFDRERVRRAAYLDDISGFDCKRFGMSPADARLLDPEQRLFLETASRALEDAGYGGSSLDDRDVGIFVGASPMPFFKEAVGRSFPEQVEQAFILNVPSSMATRLGYLRNWSGPAELVDTACSSSLKAVRDACQALARGECSLALAGGARVMIKPLSNDQSFAIETTSGKTRTFDASADGVGGGEGALAFLLKPLARAKADGDAIHAVILGGAVNQDGRSASIAAPSPIAQAHVIRSAAEDAGIGLGRLAFFEAHGTGTALGDPIEIDGLTRAFAAKPERKAWIGSVKGNFGHLDSAAGVLGMAKAILALQHGVVPRQPHFERPNPHIDFERAPVAVACENEALPEDAQPWRCGVSAFGLSGVNVHLVLEQAPRPVWPADDGRWFCVPISASNETSLRTYAENILHAVAAHPQWPLHAIVASLVAGREHLGCRLALVASTREEFLVRLMAWCLGESSSISRTVKPVTAKIEISGATSEADAREQAAAFLAGAEPNRPEGQAAWRVHLPSVPLERINCWPRFPAKPAVVRRGWVGEGVKGPQGWLFGLPVHEESFWPVAEHRLAGHPTLVGMALPGLLAEAIGRIDHHARSLRIESLSWLKPLVAKHVAGASLSLRQDGDGFSASLVAEEAGVWTDFATARVAMLEVSPRRLDLAALQARISQPVSMPASDAAGIVEASPRWGCRRELRQSEDGREALARLVLPEAYVADLRGTAWHPALLDVAASLALDRTGLVPACCREMNLYRALPAAFFAHVARREAGQGLEADCVLVNEQGDIFVELRGLLFVPLQAGKPRLHSLLWTEAARPIAPEISESEVLVLGCGPFAEELVKRLGERGRILRRRDWPRDVAGREALAGEIVGDGLARAVAVLPETGLDWPLAATMQTLCRSGLRKPFSLLAVSHAGRSGDPLSSPDAALACGLLLSLAQEEPLLRALYVELDDDAPPEALIAELDALPAGEMRPLRLCADGRRLRRELSPPLTNESTVLPAGPGCVVVTGGLGAMALTLAETLVPALGDSLALLHRGYFPPESEWEALSRGDDPHLAERAAKLLALREKRIAFRLYRCDVGIRDSLAVCLAQVRSDLGVIGGVFHTAGVAGDGFLLHKTREDFEAVLAPKVEAVRCLHLLTRAEPLRFFVLAGSRTALTGAPGQTDYAAANAWLAAFAAWRRAQGLPATVIDWNTWRGIGMAARHGVAIDPATSLAPEQAGAVLLQALASGETELVVTMPGEPLSVRFPAQVTGEIGISSAEPGLSLAERVLAIVAQGLGYETALSPDDNFYALGGDSIGGMQIVNRLQRELGLPVSLADLFSNSRLGDLVGAIERLAGTPQPDRPKAAPVRADYPVSREQLAVLRAEASAKPHTGYNLPQFLRLPDDFDFERLQAALNGLVARHEILRTRFLDPAGETPRMEILPPSAFPLGEKVLAILDTDSLSGLVRPFELSRSPLFRACVLRVRDEGVLLFFDIHHTLADARGVNILLTDLYRLYRGEALPEVGLQQKDAAWDQQARAEEEEATARAYWLGRFTGPLPKLDLPADHPRPRFHTNRAGTASFAVPDAWLDALRALAREQGITSYTLMLSLWSLLLGRLAGVDEIVIAVATDGRDRGEFEATAGMFAALLPLRISVPKTGSFGALLARNRNLHAEAMRHSAFPLNRLLGALKAPVAPERTLLSEVTFSYMNFETSAQGGFALRPVSNPSCKADLAIFVSDTGDHLFFALEYYADLFTAGRMERLGQQFLDLLRELLAQGAQVPVSALRWSGEDLPGCAAKLEALPAIGPDGEADAGILAHVIEVFRCFFNDDSIAADDSFFDLGGHSLLGLQMANRFTQESGRELTIRDVFEHPTPREMARLLAGARGEDRRIRHGEARSDGRYPLSHAQQRLYVLHHTDGGATAYNMSFVFRLEGLLDLSRLQIALQRLCERHEVLRTAFVEEDGRIWQVVREGTSPEFLSHRLDAEAFDEVLEHFRRDAVREFALDQAPLLRVRVCELNEQCSFLSLVMHHIIGDGWSMQIFFGELLALYADRAAVLPVLPVQYRDYAVWQQGRDWLAEAEYWRQTLKGAPERIALPGDAVHSGRSRSAGVVRRMLPVQVLDGLRRYARRKGVSLATLCLTLFSALLYRLTRQQDMVIGMGVAGRERAELEGLIGFFINILPIRVRLDAETEIEELLDRVHRASLEALERQDYPFDLLVREVSASRGGQRDSLINVMFEYQRYSELQQVLPKAEQNAWPECSVVDLDEFEGATAHTDPAMGPDAKYDLTLFVQDEPAGCRLKAEFNRGFLTDQSVSNWLAYLEAFMSGLVEAASRKEHENI